MTKIQNRKRLGHWILVFVCNLILYRGGQKYPISSHCEESNDEAIFWKTREIASLRSQ